MKINLKKKQILTKQASNNQPFYFDKDEKQMRYIEIFRDGETEDTLINFRFSNLENPCLDPYNKPKK